MRARILDFFDYVFNHNVIKEQKEEDKQYEDLLSDFSDLQHEVGVITTSRDRYLENCKKKSAENKILKKENKELRKEIETLKKKLDEVSL